MKHGVKSAVEGCLAALDDEIRAVRRQGSRPVHLHDGHFLAEREGFYVYAFTADTELRIPDDSRVELAAPEGQCEGFLLTAEGFEVVLALEEDLGERVKSAKLRTAPWFLLEQLQERLRGIEPGARLPEALLSSMGDAHPPPPALERAERLLQEIAAHTDTDGSLRWNEDQLRAVGQVLANPLSFIWGPPGTGKTTTLGLTVAALAEEGESLLVVAHSNVAVDMALLSVASKLKGHPVYLEGKVLRLGPPALGRELEAFPKLHARGVLREREPKLIQRLEGLEARKRRLVQGLRAPRSAAQRQALERELQAVRKELRALGDRVREAEAELLVRAQVIGCTLSKAAIAPEIYERRFDAVLVDEGSMAHTPQGLFVAGLATRRLAIFGDFRQLPPIAQADTSPVRRWLRRDLFEGAGVVERVDRGAPDPRMVLLRTQYRMHPRIASVCNALFYGGELRDGPKVERETEPFSQLPPAPGAPLVLGELPFYAHCAHEAETHSRFNPISALATLLQLIPLLKRVQGRAASAGEGRSRIGVITPYVAQARLLRKLLEDTGLADPGRVTVATVHRFQGSEREAILFDLTDGPPLEPGVLLRGGEAARLANVALSRARGKFVLLVHPRLRERLPADNPFRRLIERMGQEAKVPIDLRTQTGDTFAGLQIFPSLRSAQEALAKELASAREEVALAWPRGRPLGPLLEGLRAVHPDVECFARVDPEREGSLKQLGLTRIRRLKPLPPGLPLGVVGLERRALWVLPDVEAVACPGVRLEWPQTVKLLYAFWGLLPEGEARRPTLQSRLEEGAPFGRCPCCGETLWPQDSGRLACANPRCSYRRALTPQEATELAKLMEKRCPRCGGPLVGRKGRYSGVFLGCANYPRCKGTMDLRDIW